MQREILENSSWKQADAVRPVTVRRGNLALLATSQFKNGELVRTPKGRCVWPNPYKAGSNYLSRRVWGKEA